MIPSCEVVALPKKARVDEAYVVEKSVEEAFPNVFSAEKVFASLKSVEEAAVTVMFAVPSKETPLIWRAVWSAVAVPAFPEMEPVIVEEKVFDPEKVFASARSVEEAAVTMMEAPAFKVVPFTVPKAPTR